MRWTPCFAIDVPELLADQRDSLAIFLVGRIVVRLEREIERIQHRDEIRDQAARRRGAPSS